MQSNLFPKQIKLDDYSQFSEGNIIRLLQSSNLLLGSGARTSTAAIVLAKTLHFQSEEGELPLEGLCILELGCGIGLLGVYLGCIGANVLMADVPAVRDLAERNISMNKSLLRARVQFITANWKREACVGKCEQMVSQSSTSSEPREECLIHLLPRVDLTLVCEGGGITDLKFQLRWMGRKGMILCFLERDQENPEDYLSARTLETFLLEQGINYQKMEDLSPDYHDQRVQIYRIFRK